MPKYRVNMYEWTSVMIEVEADSEEKAIDKAFGEVEGICAQCSGWGQEWSRDTGELQLISNQPNYTVEQFGKDIELISE
jgi:hypothetical protein